MTGWINADTSNSNVSVFLSLSLSPSLTLFVSVFFAILKVKHREITRFIPQPHETSITSRFILLHRLLGEWARISLLFCQSLCCYCMIFAINTAPWFSPILQFTHRKLNKTKRSDRIDKIEPKKKPTPKQKNTKIKL